MSDDDNYLNKELVNVHEEEELVDIHEEELVDIRKEEELMNIKEEFIDADEDVDQVSYA